MEWKEVRLGDVIDYKKGFAFKSSMYKSTGTYIVRVSDTTANSVDVSLCNCISPELAHQYTDYSLKTKDIIIATVGSWPTNPASIVGKVVRVPESANNALLNQNAVRIRSNGIVDSDYIYYLLKEEHFSKYLVGIAQGSANQASITLKDIFGYSFSAPSEIKDQRRIASILSSLDRKIELNNKINADLEEMAQAIFKNWFVDFEPFKDGKFVNSELGMIPEGWKVGSPYEYVKVVYGAPYKSAKFNDNGEGLPLIRIRDLKDCKPQFYTPEILPQTEYVNMGDIVAGMDAEFVPHIWKGKTGLLNQRVCKLIPQQTSISNLFVLYLMKPELEFVQSYKTGTTVSHLGKADIDKFVVVLPPLEVVEDCSKLLDSILQRIKNISAESRNLSLLRDTLLPRLMSGEIEVPE